MTRVKGGIVARKRRKKVLKQAKGYFGSKHRLYKSAHEQVMHSGEYAFRDRKQNKRNFRKLWITRINAACRENGVSYSRFINGLSKHNIEINRKMLAELAVSDKDAFAKLVKEAMGEVKETKKSEAKAEVKKEEKKVEKKETKKEEKTDNKDLSKLTVAELKNIAKEKKVKGYTTMKKAELIDALK